MAGPDRSAIPRLTKPATAEALQHLPLDPTDGFVLSRVDGLRTVDAIADGSGLPVDVVLASLGKLAGLGLLAGLSDDDDGVDLDPAHRERIVATHDRLDAIDLYALLGVARESDKKAIKRAYFDLAGVFHPDRFFRKNLGSYKAKMEAVFARVTEAHDTLTHPEKRARYDAYLRDIELTRSYEPPTTAPPEPPPPAPEPPRANVSAAPPSAGTTPSIPPDARTRRDSLARRLLAGRSVTPNATARKPTPPPTSARAPVTTTPAPPRDPLRAHYEARRAALQRDRTLRDELAATYRRQALYEEEHGRPAEAARSWSQLANLLRDDAEAQARAAKALVQAGGDLHLASTLAQRAIALAPENGAYRATLGLVYLEAGLLKNARRELEAAERFSPQDASIAALIKRLG